MTTFSLNSSCFALLLCAYIAIVALARIIVSRDMVWRVTVVVRSLGNCCPGLKEIGDTYVFVLGLTF